MQVRALGRLPRANFALGPRLVVCVKFLVVCMLCEIISFLDMTCHLDTLSVWRTCMTCRIPTTDFALQPKLLYVIFVCIYVI